MEKTRFHRYFESLARFFKGDETADDGGPLDRGPAALKAAIAVGFLIVFLHSVGASHLASALIWACACLAIGAALGFLFGIPKVLQGGRPGGDDAALTLLRDDRTQDKKVSAGTYALQVNTNLEQISDWLCKIIVGVGLIEARSLYGHFEALALGLANDLGSPSYRSFASGIISFFSVAGFLYGYLATRLNLTAAFGKADRAAIGEAVKVQVEAKFGELNLVEANTEGLLALHNSVKYESAKAAVEKLEEAIVGFPSHRSSAMILGRLYRHRLKDLAKAISVLTRAITAMKVDPRTKADDYAAVLYNRACYNSLLAATVQDEKEKESYSNAGLNDLRESCEKCPANAELASKDEDFVYYHDNEDFVFILRQHHCEPPVKTASARADDSNVGYRADEVNTAT